jgi:hypothetical protein
VERRVNLTIDMNYFYAMTILLVLLFALLGFALGWLRSLIGVLGIFFAYVAADKSAAFIRDGLNFVLKLELGDEIIPYFRGALLLGSIIAVLGFLFGMKYTHNFRARLAGMLLGGLAGYLVSVFALEYLREVLAGMLEEQTVTLDFGYALLGQKGALALTINFFSDPESVYTVLRKGLRPAILYLLFFLLGRSLSWLVSLLGQISNTILGWVSIRSKGEEEAILLVPKKT